MYKLALNEQLLAICLPVQLDGSETHSLSYPRGERLKITPQG
jgi:hypothetical protein